MTRFAMVCILLLLITAGALAAQEIKWVRQLSAGVADFANATVADAAGNFYITGYFGGNLNFGGTSLSGAGIGDVFIAKYSSTGSLTWVKQGTSSGWNGGRGIALDQSGNVYLTGRIQETTVFDGKSVTSASQNDPFVAKYSAAGEIQWVKSGSGSGDDWGQSIAVDQSGNSYAVGHIDGSISFGTTSLSTSGAEDIFIVSYDKDGNFRWAKSAGGSGSDAAYGVAVDQSGNIYVVGKITGTITVGGTTLSGSGTGTGFLISYSPDGTLRWGKALSGTTIAEKVSVDSEGKIYLTGAFLNTVTFGSTTLTSAGQEDIFVAQFSADGTATNAWRVGGSGRDGVAGFGQSSQVVPASGGGFFLASSFENSITLGSETLTSAGKSDILIARFDAEGNPLWGKSGGGSESDAFVSVGVDGSNTAYLFGNFFSNPFRFGSSQFSPSGFSDMFLAKITQTGTVQPKASVSPISLFFATTAIGTTATESLRVRPVNSAGLIVEKVYVDDPSSGFAVKAPVPGDLPAVLTENSRLDIDITFTPTKIGEVSTKLIIETNDPVMPISEVPLGGEGSEAGILPTARLSKSTIDIGKVWIGSEGTGSLTISPANSAGLIVQDVDFNDPESFDKGFELVAPQSGGLPASLNEGGLLEVTVRYTPTDIGNQETTLLLSTNDPANPEIEVVVQAVGAIAPVANLSTFNLDFGDVAAGASGTESMTIGAGNESGLQITAITISGVDASSFTVVDPPGNTTYPIEIGEGGELTLQLQFAPSSIGEKKAVVTISTNDPLLEEAQVNLSGTGQDPSAGINDSRSEERTVVNILPNPLGAVGHVIVKVSRGEDVRVELFDIGGDRVDVLFAGYMSAGEHQLLIDGRELSTGIYICIVQVGERQYYQLVTRGM
ncbi:MAG: choice-of-anchor D domain-containing protein [Ignavibacteriae bacterium]|nr:choice-of-anchor D domain-containing protein [Ignavibacteriota bacterium]